MTSAMKLRQDRTYTRIESCGYYIQQNDYGTWDVITPDGLTVVSTSTTEQGALEPFRSRWAESRDWRNKIRY